METWPCIFCFDKRKGGVGNTHQSAPMLMPGETATKYYLTSTNLSAQAQPKGGQTPFRKLLAFFPFLKVNRISPRIRFLSHNLL